MDWFDKEQMMLEQSLNDGEITQTEYNNQLRDLERDYQSAAEESAQQEYDDELERW